MISPDAGNGEPESARGADDAEVVPPEEQKTAALTERPGERPKIPDTLSILPTRGVAVFPGIIASLSIGRPGSRKLLEESLPQSKVIGVFAQKDPEKDKVGVDDLHRVGVAIAVMKLLRQPDDSGMVIVVSALDRIAIKKVVSTEPY